jgi:hypothetical protein
LDDRVLQKPVFAHVPQQGFDPRPKRRVVGAGYIEKRSPFLGCGPFKGFEKDLPLGLWRH